MFPVTITVTNTAQLNAVMAALNIESATNPCAGHAVESDKAEAKAEAKATTAKAEKPAAKATTTAPAKEAAAEQPQPEASAKAETTHVDASPATYQDAAAAIIKLSRTKGRDAAIALLKDFGAAKLPDVKPEQFAAVIAAADAAMGE